MAKASVKRNSKRESGDAVPKNREVAARLRERILAGEWAPGTALPGLRRLAKEYAVAEITVRQALEFLRREDRVRVNRSSRRWMVKEPGGAISTTQGVVVEVVANRLEAYAEHQDMMEVQRGIEFGAGDLWMPFLLFQGSELATHLPESMDRYPVRAVLLHGVFRSAVLDQYAKMNVPVILIGPPRRALHGAFANVAGAVDEAVRHSKEHGHRRIALLLSGDGRTSSFSRSANTRFKKAISAGRSRSEVGQVHCVGTESSSQAACIAELLSKRPRITAVIAEGAVLAEAVRTAAQEQGKRVPADLSVICLHAARADNSEFSGPVIDYFELGRRAAGLIRDPKPTNTGLFLEFEWREGVTSARAHERDRIRPRPKRQ